jgi:hypothetical protein
MITNPTQLPISEGAQTVMSAAVKYAFQLSSATASAGTVTVIQTNHGFATGDVISITSDLATQTLVTTEDAPLGATMLVFGEAYNDLLTSVPTFALADGLVVTGTGVAANTTIAPLNSISAVTNAATAAGSSVITFGTAPGVYIGMNVADTTNATALAVGVIVLNISSDGKTITLNAPVKTGQTIGSGDTIVFTFAKTQTPPSSQALWVATSAASAVGSNVIVFTGTPGIQAGMVVSDKTTTNAVTAGTYVKLVQSSGTVTAPKLTVTLSSPIVGSGVASGDTMQFAFTLETDGLMSSGAVRLSNPVTANVPAGTTITFTSGWIYTNVTVTVVDLNTFTFPGTPPVLISPLTIDPVYSLGTMAEILTVTCGKYSVLMQRPTVIQLDVTGGNTIAVQGKVNALASWITLTSMTTVSQYTLTIPLDYVRLAVTSGTGQSVAYSQS